MKVSGKTVNNSYPLFREAKVLDTSDPEELGRIQLKVIPELSAIPDDDCPWCFPESGGIHGKSFGLPLVDSWVSCVVWNKYWNEITFLPFTITSPKDHLFEDWKRDVLENIDDIEEDPEEEHLVVEQFEDDFSSFHDTKNSQHGFYHPSGFYGIVNKDGEAYVQFIKKIVFHNKNSDLVISADSDSGEITFKTFGNVGNDISGDWKINVSGNVEIKTSGNTKIESSGSTEVKSSGACKIESSSITTVKGSSKVVVDAPILDFSGNKSAGKVSPSGSGVMCAIGICPSS